MAVQRAQGPNRARFLSLPCREPRLSQRKQAFPNGLMVRTAEVQSENGLVGSAPTPLDQNPWQWLSWSAELGGAGAVSCRRRRSSEGGEDLCSEVVNARIFCSTAYKCTSYRVSISADQTVLCGSCNNEFSTSNDPVTTDTFPRVCPWGQLAVSHNEGENLTWIEFELLEVLTYRPDTK